MGRVGQTTDIVVLDLISSTSVQPNQRYVNVNISFIIFNTIQHVEAFKTRKTILTMTWEISQINALYHNVYIGNICPNETEQIGPDIYIHHI